MPDYTILFFKRIDLGVQISRVLKPPGKKVRRSKCYVMVTTPVRERLIAVHFLFLMKNQQFWYFLIPERSDTMTRVLEDMFMCRLDSPSIRQGFRWEAS